LVNGASGQFRIVPDGGGEEGEVVVAAVDSMQDDAMHHSYGLAGLPRDLCCCRIRPRCHHATRQRGAGSSTTTTEAVASVFCVQGEQTDPNGVDEYTGF
jgi:hypothetical protein